MNTTTLPTNGQQLSAGAAALIGSLQDGAELRFDLQKRKAQFKEPGRTWGVDWIAATQAQAELLHRFPKQFVQVGSEVVE